MVADAVTREEAWQMWIGNVGFELLPIERRIAAINTGFTGMTLDQKTCTLCA